jgi:hypothetical protein
LRTLGSDPCRRILRRSDQRSACQVSTNSGEPQSSGASDDSDGVGQRHSAPPLPGASDTLRRCRIIRRARIGQKLLPSGYGFRCQLPPRLRRTGSGPYGHGGETLVRARTQKDLLSGLANAARLAETAIPKFEAPSIPSLPPMIVRPEVTLLRDLRDDQADQGAALAQMAAGISQLAIHAEAADERGKSEERKSSRLIALTIVIVVLAAATLIATLLH